MVSNNEQLKPTQDIITSTEDAAKQTLAFGLLYHASDAEWVGGALAGNWISDRYGIDPWVTAAGVAGSVGFVEYKLSNIAVRAFEKNEDLEQSPGKIKRAVQEVGGLTYAAFFGSANGVKINDSLGLESTPLRRKIQAGVFGTAVGLWVTPLPGYEDGADLAKDTVQDMFEDPKKFLLYSAVSIGGILGVSKVVKEGRKAFGRWRDKRSNNNTDV